MHSQPETLEGTGPASVAPFFRPMDWLTLAITFAVLWSIYLFTLAPEQTLEMSGELCTGAYYAGVPHPPGYPLWTIYSWLWTCILPFGNVAWRVEVGQSFASALGCGLLALMVSRGANRLIAGLESLKEFPSPWEKAIGSVAGFVAGLLLGLDPYMWSGSVAVNQVAVCAVPWLIAVLACLMRWSHAPHQRRYLYLAIFLYGLCAAVHQTLMISAVGVEIIIALVSPKLGRDLFLINSLIFGIGLLSWDAIPVLNHMNAVEDFWVHLIGWGSLLAGIWLGAVTRGVASEWRSVGIMGLLWLAGAAIYLYEPVSCMTDPPMQWGYPRTVEGSFHALSRGQYDIYLGNISWDSVIFQMQYLIQDLAESFNWVYVGIGLLPFAFLWKMPRRERHWIVGLTAVYFCLSLVLAMLIWVSPASVSRNLDLCHIFFTASHGVFALMIGLGLALLAAFAATHYQKFRRWGIWLSVIAAAWAIHALKAAADKWYYGPAGKTGWLQLPHHLAQALAWDQLALPVIAGLIPLAMVLGLLGMFLAGRQRAPMKILLGLFIAMPLWSGLSHWGQSEQRHHWFGYWYGHDMFTPPFTDPRTGKLSYDNDLRAQLLKDPANAARIYPEMDRNTILFGGTDPGRFCPTYSIFCDSFIPSRCQPAQDQKFDRRDCYLITQNALTDSTYLDYLRAQYNRSKQIDPPFFSELSKYVFGLGVHAWRKQWGTATDRAAALEPDPQVRMSMVQNENSLCDQTANSGLYYCVNQALYQCLDRPFTAWGAHVEKERRACGVYPPAEIYIPSADDLNNCYTEYINKIQENRVVGQAAVMGLNGLLTERIFDRNPTNAFYVEESFPLDWMYPHETPFGLIMKINRHPVPELSDSVFQLDHQFWTQYARRLCGDWITYDTTVRQIAEFAERTYLHHDYRGYTGDRTFLRDEDAQKAFSKLRSSQAGMYFWRMSPNCPPEYRQKTAAGQQALIRETEFAFKQAYAFCPYSPEAIYRYVNFLMLMGQNEAAAGQVPAAGHYLDDALLGCETSRKLDPYNYALQDLANAVRDYQAKLAGKPSPQ